MGTRLDYRADIDGLRGIAVLAVIAYHYRLPLPGGFAGVDIFFVISGYMITSIIRAELSAGNFSLGGFFERRVRRIVPALVAMLVVTLALGYFLLWPRDYVEAGTSALYATFGLANFYFLQQIGYFDLAAELHPFLHTWSLGVEEQFYLLWPLALPLLWRSRRVLIATLVLVIGLSFAASVWQANDQPQWVFYTLPFRAWELALGGLVAFLPALRSGVMARLAGFVLVGAGLAIDHDALRGFGTLALPCLGAALLVWPVAQASWADRPLRPLAGLGRISYSLYLWHWPVLVLYRHYKFESFPAPLEIALIAAIVLLLSYLSWRFIEQPFRRMAQPRRLVFARGAAMAAVVALLAGGIVASGGAMSRFTALEQQLLDVEAMWRWDCPALEEIAGTRYCTFGHDWTTATRRVAVFGDSHAEHLLPMLHDLYRGTGTAFINLGFCAPMVGGLASFEMRGNPRYAEDCRQERQRVIAMLEESEGIGMVLMSALWQRRFAVLRADPPADYPSQDELVRAALRQGFDAVADGGRRRIVVVADSPPQAVSPECRVAATTAAVWREHCDTDGGTFTVGRDDFVEMHRAGRAELERVAAAYPGTVIVDPAERLCASGRCMIELDGTGLYRDHDHFRRDLPPELNRRLGALVGLDGLDALYPAN